MYYVKGGLHGRVFMKINTILKHMLYWQYSFVYTEREFSKTITFDLQFELIHFNKNMKTKEICFKNFNDTKVILNKKSKATSNVCKRLKIEYSCV